MILEIRIWPNSDNIMLWFQNHVTLYSSMLLSVRNTIFRTNIKWWFQLLRIIALWSQARDCDAYGQSEILINILYPGCARSQILSYLNINCDSGKMITLQKHTLIVVRLKFHERSKKVKRGEVAKFNLHNWNQLWPVSVFTVLELEHTIVVQSPCWWPL